MRALLAAVDSPAVKSQVEDKGDETSHTFVARKR